MNAEVLNFRVTDTAADCATCAYADEHGWWGPDHKGTHCRKCHRSWTALGAAHCTVCCEHFASDGTARYHWSGRMVSYNAKHLDPRDVPLLKQDAGGIWHRVGERPGDLSQARVEPLNSAERPRTAADEMRAA